MDGEGEGEGAQHTTEGADAGPETPERQDSRDDSAVSTLRGLLNSEEPHAVDFLFTLVGSSRLMSSSSSSSEMSS